MMETKNLFAIANSMKMEVSRNAHPKRIRKKYRGVLIMTQKRIADSHRAMLLIVMTIFHAMGIALVALAKM